MGILRTFLAICVILEHTQPTWAFAFLDARVAVKTFFIISGFYMSLILDSKYVGKNSYKLFITNRFLRIYPVYWTVLIATLIVSLISGLITHQWIQLTPYRAFAHQMGFMVWAFAILSNLMIYGQDVIMFLGLNVKTGGLFFTNNFRNVDHAFYIFLFISQAWTLGLELTFYLIAPWILNKNIFLVMGIMLASILLKFHMYSGLGWTWDPWTYRFFPTELVFFLLGNMSYRIYGYIKNQSKFLKISQYITFMFFAFILIYPNISMKIQRDVDFVPYYFCAFISLPFIFNLTKNFKGDGRIGELSYPIYIVHILVLLIIRSFLVAQSHNLETILTIVFSILASFVLLKFIADPIEKFRQLRWAKYAKS